jgi:ketosteroid isomerase-like protein
MKIKTFIDEWLAASNAFDIDNYLQKYHPDAVLDDPSVGQIFKGHPGIRKYFEDYFIGYKTQTRILKLDIIPDNSVHIEAEFTGDFPGGKTKGIFDFTLKDEKIRISESGFDLIYNGEERSQTCELVCRT